MPIPPTDPYTDGAPEPDAHGSAALLLVESLIHSLTSLSVLSVAEAVEVLEDACDVQLAMVADAASPAPAPAKARTLALLETIAESMRIDLAEGSLPKREPIER